MSSPPATTPSGWAYALAAAGPGADTNSPVLLVETARLPAEIRAGTCGTGARPRLAVIWGDDVGAAVREELSRDC